MDSPNPWHTIPRSTAGIFLLAVFLIFTSLGVAGDIISMGRQSTPHYVLSVLLSGLFAASYAASGMLLRGRFWKAFVPLFLLQFLFNGLLANLLPDPPRPAHFGAPELARLQSRLLFDGLAIIVSVGLGYAGFVYSSISEGRRHIRAQTQKTLLESEMAAAREVQRVMVPEDLPSVPGYSLECVYRPASEVGGDFFQVIPLPSGHTLVIIGDVSGKGLPAAMIVSMIVGTLRTVSGYTGEPAEILNELNRRLYGHMHGGFATCLIARLEQHGKLTLANAGHLPPYKNGAEIDSPGSLPLAMSEAATYDQTTLTLSIGDGIVLMTDGVAEAQAEEPTNNRSRDRSHAPSRALSKTPSPASANPRELFGFARIASMLSAQASAKALADSAQQHGQTDDITVLTLSRLA